MAGTRFTHSKLIEETEGRLKRARAVLEQELEREKSTPFGERLAQWRATETKRVLELARRLRSKTEDVSDRELAGFATKYGPHTDEGVYSVKRCEGNLSAHDRNADRVLSFVRSLAPDANGVVELNAADLRRVGYPTA